MAVVGEALSFTALIHSSHSQLPFTAPIHSSHSQLPESMLDSELVVLSRLASLLLIPSGFNIAEENTPRALRWIPKVSVPPLALAPRCPASS